MMCGHWIWSVPPRLRWSLSKAIRRYCPSNKFKNTFRLSRRKKGGKVKLKLRKLKFRFWRWNGFLSTSSLSTSIDMCHLKIPTSLAINYWSRFCSSRLSQWLCTSCLQFSWYSWSHRWPTLAITFLKSSQPGTSTDSHPLCSGSSFRPPRWCWCTWSMAQL